jgi:glycyl-tRNA synthetase beta chain
VQGKIEEKALIVTLEQSKEAVDTALKQEDFVAAMQALSNLRIPVDAFFEAVTVNDPDPALRLNRLRLLSRIRQTTLKIADFSCLQDL